MKINTKVKLLSFALVAALLTGCVGGLFSGGGTAEVGVYMANTEPSVAALSALGLQDLADTGEIEEVWVTIDSIHAKRDGKWEKLSTVSEEQQRLNLMDLHFEPALLAEGRLPAGEYTEFRFQVKKNDEQKGILNNYIVVDGEPVPLYIPSDEIKPHINMNIVADTAVQLVFDVDQEQFVDRSKGTITNPRQMLKFVGLIEEEYGSIAGTIELPDWVEGFLTIDVRAFRDGMEDPVWTASLEENVLTFKIDTLLKGEYRLEATVTLLDLVEFTLIAGPIEVEVGGEVEITINTVLP